jgi:hypothetical protein
VRLVTATKYTIAGLLLAFDLKQGWRDFPASPFLYQPLAKSVGAC